MSRHAVPPTTPPRLTLEIASPPLRSSSLWSTSSSDLPPLVPPSKLPPLSRNDLFDQDWSPVSPPKSRSRSSTAESRSSTSSGPSTPGSRRSWMDSGFPASENTKGSSSIPPPVSSSASLFEKTPVPGSHLDEFSWPTSIPSSPPTHVISLPSRPRSPSRPSRSLFDLQTSPASPPPQLTSQSSLPFPSLRPPLFPSPPSSSSTTTTYSANATLPSTAGHSENPLLDTRQAPKLRLDPTGSTYLMGEGRHAKVYLSSFVPKDGEKAGGGIDRDDSGGREGEERGMEGSENQKPRKHKRRLCAAKRLFPDRESQLSGLAEAFILSKLLSSPQTSSTTKDLPPTPSASPSSSTPSPTGSNSSKAALVTKNILNLYGVKDERDGLEAPLPLPNLSRSDSRRSLRLSTGGTIAGSPLRKTGGGGSDTSSPEGPASPTTTTTNRTKAQRQPESHPPSSTRSPHKGLSLLPSLAPPLSSSKRRTPQPENPPIAATSRPVPSNGTALSPSPRSLDPEPRISLILEYCPYGHLLQFARAHPERLHANRWFEWAKEITGAVKVCHDKGVLHADIKPQNIMIAPDLSTRLCDFGMSLFLPPRNSPAHAFPTDPHGLGTPAYSPPEFVRPLPSRFSYPSDIFSLGITLNVLLTAREPFEGVRAVERMVLVERGSWYDWEERRRLREREGEEVEVEEGGSISRAASLRSERSGSLRRSVGIGSVRRIDSNESLRSLASVGGGTKDWDALAKSLLDDSDGSTPTEESDLPSFTIPPSPPSRSTHSRSTSLSLTTLDLDAPPSPNSYTSTRTYTGTSIPVQTFLDGSSIVPIEVRQLIRSMTEPRESDRPTAAEVLNRLAQIQDNYYFTSSS